MRGRSDIPAILLALGAGGAGVGEASAAPQDNAWQAEQTAAIGRLLLSRTQYITLIDCPAADLDGESNSVFVSQASNRDCRHLALVAKAVATHRADHGSIRILRADMQPTAVNSDEAYQLSALGFPAFYFVESDILTRKHSEFGSEFQPIGTVDEQVRFQKSAESIKDGVSCFLTGCPEKQVVTVTVRAQERVLSIFRGNVPTPHKKDVPFTVPLDQMKSLWVQFPDGRLQKVMNCRKMSEGSGSVSYLCGTAR